MAHRDCRSLGQCDGLVQSSTSEDADHVIYRDYHSQGNTEGEQAYPDPRIDRVAEAQRRELDVKKRIEYLKEFQMLAAELMPDVPFVHQYTTFRFRWPWLHNINWGMPAERRHCRKAARSRAATSSGSTRTCRTGERGAT